MTGVTIRPAFPDDAAAVARLAALDSARLPAGPLLIAEVDGVPWAALTLHGGRAIADPFRPTAALVELLRRRAEQLTQEPARGWRSLAQRGRSAAGTRLQARTHGRGQARGRVLMRP
jgi:hypothetical protein